MTVILCLVGEPNAKADAAPAFHLSLKGKDCDSALVFKARVVPCCNYVRNHARALLVRSYRCIFDSGRLDLHWQLWCEWGGRSRTTFTSRQSCL